MTMKQKLGRWLQRTLPFSRQTFDTLRFELAIDQLDHAPYSPFVEVIK